MQPLTVAATLYRYRLAAGYTQEELAERAGVSPRSISDIERGISKVPHAGTLERLADALGLSTEEKATLHSAARVFRTMGNQKPNGWSGNQSASVESDATDHADSSKGGSRFRVGRSWSLLLVPVGKRPSLVIGLGFILLAGIVFASTSSTRAPVAPSGPFSFAPWALTQIRTVTLGRIQAFATDASGNLFVGTDDRNASLFIDAQHEMPERSGIWKLAPSGRVFGHWYRHGRNVIHGDDVALDPQGHIYVVDVNVDRVYKLSPRGRWLGAWGSKGTGPGQFTRASAITTDSHDHIYVGDSTGRIQTFSATGSLLAVWKNCGVHQSTYCLPVDMASDLHDNLYVSEDGIKSGVRKLSPRGKVLEAWTSTGETPSQPVFSPAEVSADSRNVVAVSDGYSGGIFKYLSHGKAVLWFRVTPHDYGYPLALAIDAKGNAYVTDCCLNTIRRFSAVGTPDGTLVPFEIASVRLSNPSGIAIDRKGRAVVVTADPRATVLRISRSGSVSTSWRDSFLGRGQAHAAVGVAVSSNGNLYVVDAVASRIVELAQSGSVVRYLGVAGSGLGELENPSGVAVDASGNLYVTDTGNFRIDKFSPAGTPIRSWGESATFVRPRGVALDEAGNVYVADSGSHMVQKLSADGRVLAQWHGTRGETLVSPEGIAVDGRGNVFVTDTGDSRIKELSSSGEPVAVWGSRGVLAGEFRQPSAIAVDRAGAVWVTDTGNNRIQRLFTR